MAPPALTRLRHSPLFAGIWAGAAPLLLWAVHFAACYVVVAVGCTAVLQAGGLQPTPRGVRHLLLIVSALAVGLGLVLLIRSCRAGRQRPGELLPTVRALASVMALAGMVWTSGPLAWLSPCAAG